MEAINTTNPNLVNSNSNDALIRLNSLKTQVEQGKAKKIEAETNLKTYTAQKNEIVTQLSQFGVTPETLDVELAKLDKEISDGLAQAEALLKA
jgi:septation ring formation regulator EzrA